MVIKNKINLKGLLIVAILIIIVALIFSVFSIGYINPGGPLIGNDCIAQLNYLCQNGYVSFATGNLTVYWGQNTGINWNNTYIEFVPSGTPHNSSGVPNISFQKLIQYIYHLL